VGTGYRPSMETEENPNPLQQDHTDEDDQRGVGVDPDAIEGVDEATEPGEPDNVADAERP
jgi:hypothetical protein